MSINFVEILPENFRVPKSSGVTESGLEKYVLNPLLLAAECLTISVEDQYANYQTYSNTNFNLQDFKRTYRLEDTLLASDILYQEELYKGFLAFKSTSYDLVYYLRFLNLLIKVEELAPSGILDCPDAPPGYDPLSRVDFSSEIEIIVDTLGIVDPVLIAEVYGRIPQILLNRLACYIVLVGVRSIVRIVDDATWIPLDDNSTLPQAELNVHLSLRGENTIDHFQNEVIINNINPGVINQDVYKIDGFRVSDLPINTI